MKLRRSCTPQNSISPLSTHSSTNDEPLVRLGYCQSIKLIEQERITRASHNRFCSHSFGHFVSVTIYNGVDVLATVAIHIRAHLAHAALHLVAVEVVGIVFAQDTHTHTPTPLAGRLLFRLLLISRAHLVDRLQCLFSLRGCANKNRQK